MTGRISVVPAMRGRSGAVRFLLSNLRLLFAAATLAALATMPAAGAEKPANADKVDFIGPNLDDGVFREYADPDSFEGMIEDAEAALKSGRLTDDEKAEKYFLLGRLYLGVDLPDYDKAIENLRKFIGVAKKRTRMPISIWGRRWP